MSADAVVQIGVGLVVALVGYIHVMDIGRIKALEDQVRKMKHEINNLTLAVRLLEKK